MRLFGAAIALAITTGLSAQTNPSPQSLPYTQDFAGLAHTATAYPAGWQGWVIGGNPGAAFKLTGPTADGNLTASSGASTNSGNVHNYNGKIGFLNNGTTDLTICLALNTSGNASVQVAYDIMTIRNPYNNGTDTRINEVTLQYRVGNSGGWTSLTGPEYQNNTTLQNGNGITTPQNLQNKTVTLPSACDNQPVVQIRWASRQVTGGGARPSFAVDNLNITGSPLGNTTVAFASASSTVSEGVVTTTIQLTISDPSPSVATTVDVVISAGDPARVNGYTSQTVTFPVNDGNPQSVTITVTDDAVYDGGAAVTFTLQNIQGGQGDAAIGSPLDHVLTITENEPSPLLINEVDYDNEGVSDTLEFVEIVNTSLVPIDLNGYYIQLVNGAGGAPYNTIVLPAFSLAPGGYYVVGNDATIPNINLVTGASLNFIQNGSPDAVALRDPLNNLLDVISYEGSTLAPYSEGTGLSVINSDDATPGVGISRFPDATDTDNNSVDWSRRCLSPGAPNNSTSANCICTAPEASAISQCVDDFSWEIIVSVTSTGSGATVDITNDVNGSSALGVGLGDYTVGPFNNNEFVTVTVGHETFSLCDVALPGMFMNCLPDCNDVVGGPDVPGAPCDDLDENTSNDVWTLACICQGTLIQPGVGFTLPSSLATEPSGVATIGVSMDEAPAGPVLVEISDALTGTATSGADYSAFGTVQLTFLPTDDYPSVQSVNVIITDDIEPEAFETVVLSLSVISGPANPSTVSHTLVIQSEDLPALRLNEVDYDNAGADNAEWLELKNTGSIALNLSGYTVQFINGNAGGSAIYKTITLPSFTLAAGAYYVIGNNAAIPNLNLLETPAVDMIQNGPPDAIALRDPSATLIDVVSYEGNTAAPYTEGSGIIVANSDDNSTPLKVIARYLDGNDSDDNSVDWRAWCATPGASNATVDADADGTADCLDGCPADPNKIAPGICGCGNPEAGQACNDNNPFTTGDTVDGACTCVGTPVPCTNWTLSFTTDADPDGTSWQIVDAASPYVLASSGPLAASTTVNTIICVPEEACFNLIVTDLDGNGIPGGGWVLRDSNGERVIDNEGNGGAFTTTASSADPFCNPTGTDRLISADCDRENLLPNSNVFASENAAVSAQYGIGDQTDDGYQFAFINPIGGYSRKIFRSHATSGGFGPANAVRATKLSFNSIVTFPLPQGVLLNVRVRSRVNGNYGDWGPACRMRIDPTACTLTKLNDTPGDPNLSCNVSGKVVGASGNAGKVFAKVVYQGATPANRYKFQFALPNEGYLRNIVSTGAGLQLGIWQTAPLLCGTYTYEVRVAASFDGGTTFCPFGDLCTVEITNSQPAPYCGTPGNEIVDGGQRSLVTSAPEFRMWPNPTDGGSFRVAMTGLPESASTMTIALYDVMGQRVMDEIHPVADGGIEVLVPLRNGLPSGLYIVTITAGGITRTERLVVR